ncbi:hypothetical protein RM545_00320 [Zunongwangia sp. F260]|uniref:Uncharacterized protein n=1 Tax=Autumnicola lenta TaxID=3075593 RepID=A0ABU3CFK7_9FLAO|nr:hypothetical protein [Zunongwangia sp. F260]MDT0645120.1 hypothetical protein [Zunongwangia sp. F260]
MIALSPQYQFNYYQLETVIYWAIIVIFGIALFFLGLTLSKKLRRIKELKCRQALQKRIDSLLFEMLFTDIPVEEVVNSPEFQKNLQSVLFQRVTIKAIIGLHHNYSGNYSKKLEQFYAESGLASYSLKKLNSSQWPHVVEGIRDLSSLNYQKAYPRIVSLQNHKSTFVQTEVLLGMIKLKGIAEILKFRNKSLYLNDWVQSNILFSVKKHRISAPDDLSDLLESKNNSIVLLAIRLMNYYKKAEHYDALLVFYQQTKNLQLKKEIALVLEKTEYIN